jgi:hypothetical protein
MADIGRQGQHRLVDINPLGLPEHQAANDKSVPLMPRAA